MKSNQTRNLVQLISRYLTVFAFVVTGLFLVQSSLAQSTWTGGGGDNNWGTGANWGGSAPAPSTTTDIQFAGSTRLTPNNNYTAFDDFRNVQFNTGASSFTISGNAIDLFGKVENNSANLQTFNLTLGVSTSFIEINPVSGNLTIGSPDVFMGANQLRVYGANAKTLTFTSGSIISGTSGTFSLNQNSTVAFNSAHTYTGDSFINAGTLQINSGGSANSSTLRIGDTSGTAAATLSLGSGASISSTLVTRTGSSGVKTVASTATSGTATISGSGVFMDADLTATSASGGTLAFSGTSFDLKNQTLTVSGAGSTTISAPLAQTGGTGKLTKSGTGTLTLTKASAATGATIINGGTAVLDFSAAGAPTANIINSASALTLGGANGGGRLTLTGKAATANTQTFPSQALGAGANKITLTPGASGGTMGSTITAAITQPANLLHASLQFSAAGTTTLSGNLSVSPTFVNAVHGNYYATFGTDDWAVTSAGGVVQAPTYVSASTVFATGSINTITGSFTYGVAATDPLAIRFADATGRTVTMNDTSFFIGGILVASTAGTSAINGSGTIRQFGSATASGSDFHIIQNSANDFTVGAALNNNTGTKPMALNKSGPGKLILNNNVNTYSAGLYINEGTVQVGNGGATGALGTGGVTNHGILIYNRNNTVTDANAIHGPGSLSQIGSGTTTLSGASTYTGGTTIANGTLQISADNNLGATSSGISLNGGTLAVTATHAGAHAITVGASGGYISVGTVQYQLNTAGQLTGSGTLTNNGGAGGSLWMQQANASFSGNTVVNSVVTEVGVSNALGSSAVTVNTGGELAVDSVTFTNSVTVNGGTISPNSGTATIFSGPISIGASGMTVATRQWWNAATQPATLSGVVSGGGMLTKTANETLTLSGVNTYSGETTISGGTLRISSAGQLGSGTYAANITNNAAFNYNSSAAQTLSGIISGSGSLTESGAGTLTISGANTYTGGTAVNSSILKLTGGSLGNTAISFSGTSTFAVQPSSATTISAGNTATAAAGATLTLGANNTFDMNDGAVSTFNLVQESTFAGSALTVSGGPTLKFDLNNSSADLLAVTKGASASGTVTVTLNTAQATSWSGSPTFTIITAASGLNGATWSLSSSAATVNGTDYTLSIDATSGTAVIVTATAVGAGSITAPGTFPGAVSTTYGAASSPQSVSVSGSGLTANITATAATTGLQVSSDGTTYGVTAIFTQSGGNASGTLSVRLATNAPVTGSYNSKNIALTSLGVTTVNVATTASGNTVTAKALTVNSAAAQNKFHDGTTAAIITGTLNGVTNGDSISLNGTGTFASSAVGAGIAVTSTSTLGGSSATNNYTLTQPTGLTASILDTGVWTNTAGGYWGTNTNWQNSLIATGSGNTADFNQVDITADTTVNLDTARTIGNLIFGGTNAGWILSNNATPANTLTLAGSAPTITVHTLGTGKSAAISAVVAGSSGLTKTGNGKLTLSGTNTFTGGMTVSNGTVQFAADNNLGASASGVTLNGGTLAMVAAGTVVDTHVITVGAAGGTIDLGDKQLQLVAANLFTGSGALTNTGVGGGITGGSMWIQAANTGFSGPVYINGAVIEAGVATALGSGAVTVSTGGELAVDNVTFTNAVTVNGGTISPNSGNSTVYSGPITIGASGMTVGNRRWWDTPTTLPLTISGAISGGALTLTGGGTLTLNNGGNSYSGGTFVNAGMLTIGNSTALGSGKITLTNGTTCNLANSSSIFAGNTVELSGASATATLSSANAAAAFAGTFTNSSDQTLAISGATQVNVSQNTKQFQNVYGTVNVLSGATLRFSSSQLGALGAEGNGGDTALFNVTGIMITRNGGSVALGALSGAGSVTVGNVGGSVAYTIGARNSNATFSGVISDNFVGSANKVSVVKTGSGTQTFSGTNTYSGNTTINVGTLALTANGSISNTPRVTVAGGATLDVSGLSATFALSAGQMLANSGATTATNSGNLNTSSGNVVLAYASGTPSLNVASGTLTLSGSTTFTVNNTGAPLAYHGSYKLIEKSGSGTVAGSLPSVSVTNGGAAGPVTLQVVSGELYVSVNNVPTTTNLNLSRSSGLATKVRKTDIAADADSDALTFTFGNTTNGATLMQDATFIYVPTNNVNDQFAFTVNDAYGGTNTGTVNITIATGLTGQPATVTYTGNMATATFYGVIGYPYNVERSTNGMSTWQVISNYPSGGVMTLNDNVSGLDPIPASAFYRLSVP